MKIKSALRFIGVFLVLVPLHGSWFSDRIGVNWDLNKEVGTGLGSMGAPVAEKFEESGNRLIDRMSATLDTKLVKIDQIAQANEQRIQAIVTASISQVDQSILADLEKADEILEKRLGNADVIAAKVELGFEQIVRRILLLGCILVFLTAMALRISGQAKITSRISADALLVGGALAALYVIYLVSPHGNIESIVKSHEQGYHDAMTILDVREAKYHLAQLKLLSADSKEFLGKQKKLELLEAVISRPAMYQTKEGVLDFQRKLAQATFLSLRILTSQRLQHLPLGRLESLGLTSTVQRLLARMLY